MKPLCMSYNLCAVEFPVVNPLGMQMCDLNDFALDSATWSIGGTRGSTSSSKAFLRIEDCLAFGCPLRFPNLVVAAGFESDVVLFDFVSEVDFPFHFATGAVDCGSRAENLG